MMNVMEWRDLERHTLDLWQVEWVFERFGKQTKFIAVNQDAGFGINDILALPQFSDKTITAIHKINVPSQPVEFVPTDDAALHWMAERNDVKRHLEDVFVLLQINWRDDLHLGDAIEKGVVPKVLELIERVK